MTPVAMDTPRTWLLQLVVMAAVLHSSDPGKGESWGGVRGAQRLFQLEWNRRRLKIGLRKGLRNFQGSRGAYARPWIFKKLNSPSRGVRWILFVSDDLSMQRMQCETRSQSQRSVRVDKRSVCDAFWVIFVARCVRGSFI